MSWIKDLLCSHKELESPDSFWFWAALATLSAIVKDELWLNRGGAWKLYPNIYVMLYADSGLKKGPPIALSKALVKKVNNTRLITGRSSIQGILKELGTAYTLPGGRVMDKSVGYLAASEFSSSLVEDKAAMDILTDLYDRQWNEDDWRSLLKMESFKLKDPTLTMFGGINEAHFEHFFGMKDIRGGFIGRMFVIVETEVSKLNSLAYDLKNPPNINELVVYLKDIAKLKGPFQYGIGVDKFYDEWYNKFYTEVKVQKLKDLTGTINRFGDSVLKVAMLLSLGENTALIIQQHHMEEAITVCEKLIGNIRKTTLGKQGKGNFAYHKTLIIQELLDRDNHKITREQLMKKYWMHFEHDELDRMIISFEASGLITTENIGNQIVYKMAEAEVEKFKRYLEGKNEK